MESFRINESNLTNLINDLQLEYNTLMNQLKNANTEKENERIKQKKVQQHCKLIAKLLVDSVKLKSLLSETKHIK
jgi:hypothetical protein